ncbi:hypothetical protein M378DRAFT_165669 [Amanita muscaria Koide BX008]|uniref:Uncharacterized protein n=1 Tax=Amanita muscaria (strain Koide BX008) TaxID=946122 RepID=A0A0C2X195_AMAMK|nr:hypothetical protein M378DRAFT_165669 [Amanita muscaria Koide BX008]
MVERASTPENLERQVANLTIDSASTLDDCLQPSNPASIVLFKEISKSISETHQQLRILFQRSLRMLSTRGKRPEASVCDDIRTEIEGATAPESKLPVYEAPVGSEVGSSEQLPVASRCIDGESDSPEDSISLAGVDMGINHVREARGDLRSQGKQRIRSITMSEVADFMDLDDPFACHMVGSPRVVRNLDSVLPPTHRSTNKVVEARKRFRRTAQRPLSAGRRPGSAGRRPGSANGGKARRQVELRVGAPAATSRGARSRPQTPKKLPTPRSVQLGPSSLRDCAAPTCTKLSEESQLSGLTSPSSALSIAQQQTNSRSSKAASHRGSARTVAFSHQTKRGPIASSSHPTPLRPATPKRRLAHTSLSPPTFPAARPLRDHRKSFVIRQFIPFMLPSGAPPSTAAQSVSQPLAHSKI